MITHSSHFSADLVSDTSQNRVIAVPLNNAVRVIGFDVDMANPTLVGFDFNLDIGFLFLSFDEYVNISTLVLHELVLQDSQFAMESNYSLTDAIAIEAVSSNVNITLTPADLNAIKILPLCSSQYNCYLSFSNDTIKDTAGLPVNSRLDGNALNVATYSKDVTDPELVSFASFNLETGIIELLISEAINATNVDVTAITIQTLFEEPLQKYTLTDGEISVSDDGTTIEIKPGAMDINFIKSDPQLCTTRSTCYFVATEAFLQDTSGNSFKAILEEFPGNLCR